MKSERISPTNTYIMKKEKHISRYSIVLAVAIGYFLPVLGLTYYSNMLFGYSLGWEFFSAGVTTAFLGSLFFLWRISKWTYTSLDNHADTSPHAPEIKTSESHPETYSQQEKVIQDDGHLHELQHYKEENLALTEKLTDVDSENQSLKSQCGQVVRELEAFKSSSHQHLEQQQPTFVNCKVPSQNKNR